MSFWNENRLDQICSPAILNRFIQGYVKNTNAMEATVKPAASKNLVGATRPQLIEALFSRADADFPTFLREAKQSIAPQEMGDITLLPEVWKFKIDPSDDGASPLATYRKKAPPWGKPDYNDSSWTQLSTYNVFDKQGFPDYTGVFWYRLKFTAPDFKPGESIWLRFGGLDDDGTIYVNGVLVGEREAVKGRDWETSFAYDVTKRIKPGQENLIAVRGLNLVGAGGLWRPVGLYARYSERN
jgi:hypothetical protein